MKRGKETKRDKPSFKSISTLSRIMDSSNDVGLSRSHHSVAFLRDLGTDDLDHTVESKEIPITTHAERRTTTRTKRADRDARDKPSPSSHLVSSRLVSSISSDHRSTFLKTSFPLRIKATLVASTRLYLSRHSTSMLSPLERRDRHQPQPRRRPGRVSIKPRSPSLLRLLPFTCDNNADRLVRSNPGFHLVSLDLDVDVELGITPNRSDS